MPPRFWLTEDQINSATADQWLQTQQNQLADTWLNGQLNPGLGQPPPPPPQPAPEPPQPTQPVEGPAAPAEPSVPPEPAQGPQGPMPADAPVLDLSKPPPYPPDAPLPTPLSRPLPQTTQPVAAQSPTQTGGLADVVRQTAAKYGIDPEVAIRVAMSEGGLSQGANAGDAGSSFGPFQLHYGGVASGGNRVAGLGDAFTAATGLDARDPNNVTQAIDFALKNAAQSGWGAFHGAARAGIANFEGIGGTPSSVASTSASPADISLSQFGDKTLSYDEAAAACGPFAAMRLAATYGNNIPASVAIEAAKRVGWTSGAGMAGIASEKKLFDSLNLPAELDTSGDWNRVVSAAGNGQMVTISTPGHYFTASGTRTRPDGQTELYVGQSGLDLRGGKAWMTPQEIEQRMGSLNGALFSDPGKAVSAGEWMQRAAADHGVQPDLPDQVLASLDQDRQRAGVRTPTGLEQVTQPFADAFRQVGDVVGGVANNALSAAGLARTGQEGITQGPSGEPVPDYGAAEQSGRARLAARGISLEPQGLTPLNPDVTQVPGILRGPALTTDQELLDQASPDAMNVARQQLSLAGVTNPNDSQLAEALRGSRLGEAVAMSTTGESGGQIPKTSGLGNLIPEAPPPSTTGPALGKMVGTAEQQAAVGAPDAGRAANILLEKFPEDVRPHLQNVADTFAQFAGQRRGVITDTQAEANAAEVALGTTPEKWIKTPAGKAFNQEQAIALGNTLTQVGKEYDALLTTTQTARTAGSVTPEMEAQLADKTLEFAALAGVRSGAAAEAGRALRAFRTTLNGGGYADRNKAIDAAFKAIGADKEKFAQWVETYSQLDDPVAKYKMLQGLQTPSWWDRISLLRYASMLSSTTTHMVNAFGNVVNLGLDVALKPVSVGIDVARAGVTGGERTRYMGELAPQVKGTLDGAVAGMSDAWNTLKTGVNPSDLGKFENIRPGFQSGNKVVDAAVEMPLRLLGASDSIFRGAARGGFARAAAARKGIQEGLTGDALRTRIDDIMQNLPAHPDIVQEADKSAAQTVLQEPNRFASLLTNVGRGPGAQNMAARIVREIIVPFAKTPANIFRQGAEMTPYGLLKVRDLAKAGETGAATDAAARVAFGSAVMVGVGALAANGAVTAGYPADPAERDTLPTGWQPWSVRMPNGEGGHTYISFSQLGPIAIPMAIAAIAGNTARSGLVTDPGTVAGSLGKFMVDQTFLQGISALTDAFKDPKRYGENFTEQMATSFVPYAALAREVTRITGQADRNPKGAIQAIQALIPGVAGNVPRRQDALGRDIYSTQTGIGAAVSPAKYSSTQAEPVLNAFRDVGMGLPSAPKEIRVKSSVTGSTSPPMALNENEQNQYQTLFGQRIQERLTPLVNSPDWQRRSADVRKRLLEQQVQAARDYAESQIYRNMAPDDRQKRMTEGRVKQQVKPLPVP